MGNSFKKDEDLIDRRLCGLDGEEEKIVAIKKFDEDAVLRVGEACREGRMEDLKTYLGLVTSEQIFNATIDDGQCLLYYACESKVSQSLETIEYLIRRGANVDGKVELRGTILHYVVSKAASKDGDKWFNVVELLISYGAKESLSPKGEYPRDYLEKYDEKRNRYDAIKKKWDRNLRKADLL